MSKTTKVILTLLAAAAAVSTAAIFWGKGGTDRPVARITLNGELIQEIDLEEVTVPYSFTVEGEKGLTNTILVEHGRIRVSQAGCPDQICVNQGFISDGTAPIVCLPNRLMIQIVGGGDALDAATG